MRRALRLSAWCVFAFSAWFSGRGQAQIPLKDRVLVIYDSKSSESKSVARYYMQRRDIPPRNECGISVTQTEHIPEDEFLLRVKIPVRKCLDAFDRLKILYLVFSYKTPFAILSGNRTFSLDQMMSDPWDDFLPPEFRDPTKSQPYFSDAQSQGNVYLPFVSLASYREKKDAKTIYSVWRLDAASADLSKGLVDKAIAAEAGGLSGTACFDLQSAIDSTPDMGTGSGDWDIHQSAVFARKAGYRVIEDSNPVEFGTSPAPARCDSAALYAGWYSYNHYNDAFTWVPGAIGFHLDSASAVNPRAGTNWVANAILKGITITSGSVSEPFLSGLPHPDQIFFDLFQGANVGDAVLRSTRWLKWVIVNVGDPLYRPFPGGIAPFNSPHFDQPLLAVIPQTLVGGNPVSVYFHIPKKMPTALPVAVKLEPPDLTMPLVTVMIPEGADSIAFRIGTKAVASESPIRISLTADGVSMSNVLILYPAPQTR